MPMNDSINSELKIGVSSCLLGNEVRFDGGHKHDRYITGTLGNYFTFVPVCPEVECGLPIPREAMRLTGDPENPTLVTNRTGVDHTARMINWAKKRVVQLEQEARATELMDRQMEYTLMQGNVRSLQDFHWKPKVIEKLYESYGNGMHSLDILRTLNHG